MQNECFIQVKNGYKKYQQSDYVLKNTNMDVSKGSIYSLLGPSGCGKTTLLSCIVGLQKLSSGFIFMPSIQSPLDIGYMPQETALETVCTIEETFYMYGLMFGMSKQKIYKRLEELSTLLHLPDRNILISSLSGGQQRRISFAVALLHNPGTLLLDEPTVGLDPLLKLTIWEYLKESVKNENRTVIITTHYIEEARGSDKAGFMRDGRILIEEKPEIIVQTYQGLSLDDVFVEICKEQITSNLSPDKVADSEEKARSSYSPQNVLFNVGRFKSHVYKDYLWTKRNFLLLMLLMVLPVTQSLLFVLTYGRYPSDLKVGLLTEESQSNSVCSTMNFLRYYNEDFSIMNCSTRVSLSCEYLKNLRDEVDVVLYNSFEEANSDSLKNKIWGFVHINSNFTEAVISRLLNGWSTNDLDVETSLIDVHLDMTNYVISHHIRKKLVHALTQTVKYMSRSCYFDASVGLIPIRIVNKFYEGGDIVGSGSEAAGFISGFSFYFSLMFTASALFVEKTSGVTDRYKVIGTTFLEIVAGHLVIQILLLTLQKTIMISIIYGAFGYSMVGNIALVYTGLFLIEFVGISLGVFLSVLIDATFTINILIVFFSLTLFFLGGVGWPEEAMHWLLQIGKWIVPGLPGIASLRNVIIKDGSLSSPTVYTGYLACVLWIIVISIGSFVVIKIKKR